MTLLVLHIENCIGGNFFESIDRYVVELTIFGEAFVHFGFKFYVMFRGYDSLVRPKNQWSNLE